VPCRWLDAAAARFAVRVRETDEHWQPCSLRNNFPVLCSDRLRCIVRQKDRHLGHCRVMELLNQPESELRSLCVFFQSRIRSMLHRRTHVLLTRICTCILLPLMGIFKGVVRQFLTFNEVTMCLSFVVDGVHVIYC